MNKMNLADGWALAKMICGIIEAEMAQTADHTWKPDVVAQRLREIEPEMSRTLDVRQAITDAVFGEPVGTNMVDAGPNAFDDEWNQPYPGVVRLPD